MANCSGEWVQEKLLGRGGFGVVLLFRHKHKNERIVVKYCHRKDMSAQNIQRWSDEVKILNKLKHPNIIGAVNMPEGIIHPEYDSLPPLCMEYCEGGDLRSYLRINRNCCGLFEVDVRKIAADIASALQYLHLDRIIHRDVKPENIVLQKLDGVTIYKLIDLGYAKELDYRSLAQSYVGTLQYLAPEFFKESTSHLNYSRAVDYWSYGLILTECIVGKRPFLHDVSYINSLPYIFDKNDDIIYMTCEVSEPLTNVEKHNKLPKENHLSNYLLEELQHFLQQMLKTDDKVRGRPDCWSDLEKILKSKVVNIYCVSTNQLLSVCLDSMPKMAEYIVKETEIRIEDFFLLLKSGIVFDVVKDVNLADKYANSNGFEEAHIFLYKKSEKDNKKPLPHAQFFHNDLKILQSTPTLFSKREMLRKWSHAVYLCQKYKTHFAYLEQAMLAATECLRETYHFCKVSRQEIRNLNQDYLSQNKILSSSLDYDIQRCADSQNACPSTDNFLIFLENMKIELHNSLKEKDEVNKKELHFLPDMKICETFIEGLKYESKSEFDKILPKSCEMYDNLKSCKSNDEMKLLRSKMISLIKKMLADWDLYSSELHHYISNIVSHYNKLVEIKPVLLELRDLLKKCNENLMKLTLEKEKEFMNLILCKRNFLEDDLVTPASNKFDYLEVNNVKEFVKEHEDNLIQYKQFVNNACNALKRNSEV